MKRNYKSVFLVIFLITLLILYLLNSTLVVRSILEYTNLFITKLFPVSFLFYIFSSLLIDYGFVEIITNTFHLNGSIIYVVIMSIISGFPSGAKYTKELFEKNLLSEKRANHLLIFTHFPNPLFILGSVSSVIKDSKTTIMVLIILILSNLIIGFFTKPKEKEIFFISQRKSIDFSKALSNAIYVSFKTLVIIYGTSIFFYLITVVFNHYITLAPFPYVLLNGLFDITKGIFSTPLIHSFFVRTLLIISFLSFGGISIHFQVKSIISDTSLQYKNFLLGRILQVLLANLLFIVISMIF